MTLNLKCNLFFVFSFFSSFCSNVWIAYSEWTFPPSTCFSWNYYCRVFVIDVKFVCIYSIFFFTQSDHHYSVYICVDVYSIQHLCGSTIFVEFYLFFFYVRKWNFIRNVVISSWWSQNANKSFWIHKITLKLLFFYSQCSFFFVPTLIVSKFGKMPNEWLYIRHWFDLSWFHFLFS